MPIACLQVTSGTVNASGGLLNLTAEDNSASSSDFNFGMPAPVAFARAPLASPTLRSPSRPQASSEYPHPFDTMESLTLTSSLTPLESGTALEGRPPSKRNLMDSAQELASARQPARSSDAPVCVPPAANAPAPANKRTSAVVLVVLLALAWSGLLCNRAVLVAASSFVLARAAIRPR